MILKKLNYIYWLLKWVWVWPEMPMKSIWLLCLRTALKQLTMHGNGVIKAFIGQICFKQCLVIIYNWLLYRIARVKVWFSVASLTLWGWVMAGFDLHRRILCLWRLLIWNTMLKVLPFQSSSLGLQNCSLEEVWSLRNGNADSLPGREILSSVINPSFDTFHVSLSGATIVLVNKFYP